jgi:hypothetical protein
MQRLLKCLMLLPLFMATWWASMPSSPRVLAAPSSAPEILRTTGAGSCASVACHGGSGLIGSKGSEYTIWAESDPHAKAYAVLYDRQSYRIVKNLQGANAEPAQNRVCLSCHAANATDIEIGLRLGAADDFGCESCHGPARKWLATHYLPGWKRLTAAQKADLGMRPTKSIAERAQVCVDCHVGSANRDVNHDLIAAGHPRLNFEFGSYLAVLPKHWSEQEDKARYPDLEAQAWAIGQVVAARAALDLLAYRAGRQDKPWPEFAEYDCFACHHELREPSGRQNRGSSDRHPGALAWSSWYYSMLPQALESRTGRIPREIVTSLRGIDQEMSRPYPDRKRVVSEARGVSALLDPEIEKEGVPHFRDPTKLRGLFDSVARKDLIPAETRDQAAQRYLASAALYHSLGDLGHPDPQLKALVRSMRARLDLPSGYNRPPEFEPKQPQQRTR